MLTKDEYRRRLRELNVVPPSDATSEELASLLRRVKALKDQTVVRPPGPRSRPTFGSTSPGATREQPFGSTSSGAAVAITATRLPDHQRRPHDPMAGW